MKELVKDNELPIKHRIASSSENNARGEDAVPRGTEEQNALPTQATSSDGVSASFI